MKTVETGFWTFFCNPNKYNINGFLLMGKKEDSWGITAWQKDWFKPGQFGVVRVGVDNRSRKKLNGDKKLEPGIYGIVKILSEPFFSNERDEFWYEQPDKERYCVRVQYFKNLINEPLLLRNIEIYSEIKTDKYLLGGFQATSMPLQEETYKKIYALSLKKR